MKSHVRGVVISVLLITIAIVALSPLKTRAAARKSFPTVTDHEESPNPVAQEVMPCSSAVEFLDFAMLGTRKLEGTYLIIIARLGTGETSSRLNKRRLSIVDEFIKRDNSDLKYVLAEGSRVKGLGRIELYVGGRLLYVMPLKKNAKGYCFPGEGN